MTETKPPSAEAIEFLEHRRPNTLEDWGRVLDAFAKRAAAEAPQVIIVPRDEYNALLEKLSSGELIGKEYLGPSDEFLAGYMIGKRIVTEKCALWHDRRYIELRDSDGLPVIVGAAMAAHRESAEYFRSGQFSR